MMNFNYHNPDLLEFLAYTAGIIYIFNMIAGGIYYPIQMNQLKKMKDQITADLQYYTIENADHGYFATANDY